MTYTDIDFTIAADTRISLEEMQNLLKAAEWVANPGTAFWDDEADMIRFIPHRNMLDPVMEYLHDPKTGYWAFEGGAEGFLAFPERLPAPLREAAELDGITMKEVAGEYGYFNGKDALTRYLAAAQEWEDATWGTMFAFVEIGAFRCPQEDKMHQEFSVKIRAAVLNPNHQGKVFNEDLAAKAMVHPAVRHSYGQLCDRLAERTLGRLSLEQFAWVWLSFYNPKSDLLD